jgi:phosphate transport system substrate-binding protein
MGGIVPVINVEGIKPGELVIDGPTLARIFLGEVKSWDDAALKKLNPNVKLPATAIAVVHRSDGSGTTFNFTDYLVKASPEWKSKVGSSTAVEWPVGIGAKGNEGVANNVGNTKGSIGYVEYAYAKQNSLTHTSMVNRDGKTVSWPTGVGGKGNEGVAGYVKQIPNSIGYVEYAYVVQNGMNYAQLQNAAGAFVSPSAETFSNAAETADWASARDFNLVMTNAPGPNAYPITATTFILMPKQPKDKARSDAALSFFRYALGQGQQQARKLDYVPLPDALVKQIETYIGAGIK